LLNIICACDLVRAQATHTACYIHAARLGHVVVFIVSHIILKATFKVVVIALLSSLLLNIGAEYNDLWWYLARQFGFVIRECSWCLKIYVENGRL
jgi:hypothetical protein